jgi:hypothetical protein
VTGAKARRLIDDLIVSHEQMNSGDGLSEHLTEHQETIWIGNV